MALFPGAMGDLVLAMPTLRRLRDVHPGARIVLAVDHRWIPLARAAGLADDVEAIDGVDVARVLGGGEPPAWWGRSPRLYAWWGACDVSLRRRLASQAGEATFARVVRGDGPLHAAEEYMRAQGWCAAWSELVTAGQMPPDRVPRAPIAAVGDERILVVHRGAGGRAKRWATSAFEHVAAWWRARGGPVVDVRGPDDDELPALVAADRIVRPAVIELAGLLGRAAAFLGNDSGPAHVAGMVGVPGVVVYGPTDPARWRPLSHRLIPLRATHPGRGHGCHPEPDAAIHVLARCVG